MGEKEDIYGQETREFFVGRIKNKGIIKYLPEQQHKYFLLSPESIII